MRHKKKGRYLNRNSSHYRSMFNNMMCSLLKYEIIKTTVSKAKELRSIVEPLINRAKVNNVANQRLVFSYIKDKFILSKLFNDIGPYFFDRSGGYTKILKCGFRLGDRSKIAYIKLVDRFNKK